MRPRGRDFHLYGADGVEITPLPAARSDLVEVRAKLLDQVAAGHQARLRPSYLGLDLGAVDFAFEAEFALDPATGRPMLVGVAIVDPEDGRS